MIRDLLPLILGAVAVVLTLLIFDSLRDAADKALQPMRVVIGGVP